MIIENLGIEIDQILDPLLSRAFVKRGKAYVIRLGGE